MSMEIKLCSSLSVSGLSAAHELITIPSTCPDLPPRSHVLSSGPSETVHHVHRLSQRCRRRAAGRHPEVRLLRERLQREHRGELQLRGQLRQRSAGQEEEDGVPENCAQRCGAAGGQARAKERGERTGEGQDARAVKSVLAAEDVTALGAPGHQAVQAGHSAPGVQLHRPPPTDTGQRQVRERIYPPGQPDVAIHGCW